MFNKTIQDQSKYNIYRQERRHTFEYWYITSHNKLWVAHIIECRDRYHSKDETIQWLINSLLSKSIN